MGNIFHTRHPKISLYVEFFFIKYVTFYNYIEKCKKISLVYKFVQKDFLKW